jgi:hypothetical protein
MPPLCPRYRRYKAALPIYFRRACLFFSFWLYQLISFPVWIYTHMTHKAISRYVSFFLAVRSIFFFFFGRRRRPRTRTHSAGLSLCCCVWVSYFIFSSSLSFLFLSLSQSVYTLCKRYGGRIRRRRRWMCV